MFNYNHYTWYYRHMDNNNTQGARKNPKSFRISVKGERLLLILSEHIGVNQTSIIEMAIREMAERKGIDVPTDKKEEG
ncbi:MAG: hypothetical protein EBR82_67950 [Caulobacteraceae bacterium]|nr:hypothetical protein [Caulobacteraceae bacterium]